MKLSVKTLKGVHFEIKVQLHDTIMAVKKQIEEIQGKDAYPCGQQLLIHQGKVLKDDTTIEENVITENSFLVVMLTKQSKSSTTSGVSATPSSTTVKQGESSAVLPPSPTPPVASPVQPAVSQAAVVDPYAEAASNLVGGNSLEQTIQQILDMGGGTWDRETVVRALRAAYNNPERAIDYLYSGIPEVAEIAVPVAHPSSGEAAVSSQEQNPSVAPSGGPNVAPLNLFPQGAPNIATGNGTLDFLRDNEQFQQLRSMVQENPQILQPMLQELSKQNPQLMGLIEENQEEFLSLINETDQDAEEDQLGDFEEMPHTINVTEEEHAAIERLEAMGFEHSLVIEAFLACDKNEQLAANYLLEHAADPED